MVFNYLSVFLKYGSCYYYYYYYYYYHYITIIIISIIIYFIFYYYYYTHLVSKVRQLMKQCHNSQSLYFMSFLRKLLFFIILD